MSIYNTPLEERFGEKLEELREGKNMTREQLADQVGLILTRFYDDVRSVRKTPHAHQSHIYIHSGYICS